MPYRRTDQVIRKQAARQKAILEAARQLAVEQGMAAVQIAAVAERASIAAGTVYRYFPSKADLVKALIVALSESDLAAMRKAAQAAPGPLSALSASIATFCARALRSRRLTWAAVGEPAGPEVEEARLAYRRALAREWQNAIAMARARALLPDQNPGLAAAALVGALLEGLLGPLTPAREADAIAQREAVQALTLLALRALGVFDARARGLVAQTVLPVFDNGTA